MADIQVKERPILMSAPMVRACLNEAKTQTRRVLNLPKKYTLQDVGRVSRLDTDEADCWFAHLAKYANMGASFACAYGKPGDRLWVKESWALRDCGRLVSLKPDAWPLGVPSGRLQYIATDEAPGCDLQGKPYWWNKRSSLFMPRWASRITLEITDVRAERLQDISLGDAHAEGIPQTHGEAYELGLRSGSDTGHEYDNCSNIENYAHLWDKINGAGAWDKNPWVWCVSFRRLEAS